MITFVILALVVWLGMNVYACWRLVSLLPQGLATRRAFLVLAASGFASFPLARAVRGDLPEVGGMLETAAVTWLGMLLLFCTFFAVVDVITLGGAVWRPQVRRLRLLAAFVALALSCAGLIQGSRDPVVRQEEIVLPGLPKERDGLKLLLITDAHLGRQIGREWLRRLVARADNLKPDLIALGGDLIDHDAELVQPLIPELQKLRAPLGVWSVLGNHDIYGGALASTEIMRAAGFRVLLDESAEAVPGLRIAGVKDLGVRRGSPTLEHDIRSTLAGAHPGREGIVYLSHTPEQMEIAADAGAGLMLSGHTHGGQIWPFNYLVSLRYGTLAGRYRFGHMTLFVSRGAGTWGPRMRLWQPGEIVLITLRSP